MATISAFNIVGKAWTFAYKNQLLIMIYFIAFISFDEHVWKFINMEVLGWFGFPYNYITIPDNILPLPEFITFIAYFFFSAVVIKIVLEKPSTLRGVIKAVLKHSIGIIIIALVSLALSFLLNSLIIDQNAYPLYLLMKYISMLSNGILSLIIPFIIMDNNSMPKAIVHTLSMIKNHLWFLLKMFAFILIAQELCSAFLVLVVMVILSSLGIVVLKRTTSYGWLLTLIATTMYLFEGYISAFVLVTINAAIALIYANESNLE